MSQSPAAHAQRVVGIIPARLHSTRLPRKVLLPIAGRPLLAWVYEAARRCTALQDVLIAADDEEVAALCHREGWPCRMTSPALTSGTDRVHSVSLTVDADIYVNIQGDEPLLQPAHIDALLAPFTLGEHVAATTLRTPCALEDRANPNVVKVVTANDGRALYFSRATIPHQRDAAADIAPLFRHLGLYAYRRRALAAFSALPPSPLEQVEMLEQLRLLENGIALYVGHTDVDSIGVDTADDVLRVEPILRAQRLAHE